MRRAFAIIVLVLFTLPVAAAPRDDDHGLLNRIIKAVQKVARRLAPQDELMPPKG